MEQVAALRAEWFAQLAEAIEGAQQLAWQLGTRDGSSVEARELYGRLEAARVELESIRGIARLRDFGPVADTDWLRILGWTSSLKDPGD